MESADAVVMGAGPAGLGAGLALARAGARVTVLEAGDRVGGLSVTRERDGYPYDLGGHIPFVRSEGRRAWLADLLGDDLGWVDRPVSCVRDGRLVRGRYLDQRPERLAGRNGGPWEGSAADALGARFGDAFVDAVMRPYLEKIDGTPLERIPAERVRRLLEDQSAPQGFWFPRRGIGQLMEAMAAAIRDAGGEVRLGTRVDALEAPDGEVAGVVTSGPGGEARLATPEVVVAVAAGLAAPLVRPAPPLGPPPAMRAVVLVVLAVDRERVTHEPWIQVDDPDVPFARAFEPRNWSARLAPPAGTSLGLECYCRAEADDPVWGLDDAALARRCAEALVAPLGWLRHPGEARLVEVVRMPRAYPVPDLRQLERVMAPVRALEGIGGLHLVPGAAVIEAIEAGERAAGAVGARANGGNLEASAPTAGGEFR
jgi:protoporphyrinogen oxidase